MPTAVSDARSNFNDQIAHAANVLKRSPRLRKLFEAICKGGTKPKSVAHLMKATGFNQVTVLQLGGKLADQQIVQKTKIDGTTAYAKDRFYAANREKVLGFATNPKKLKSLPTKYSTNQLRGTIKIRASTFGSKVQIKQITCDDFEQFAKVKKFKTAPAKVISEKLFKKGIQKLIGEKGDFRDWGGETNDLYTTRLTYKERRRSAAFAFKGPGTKGPLTPGKLGKNGDQIQRLFLSPADIFIVQYHSQISQSVVEQMKAFATINSLRERKRIFYGTIDGNDTNRILAAYPRQFGHK